MKIKEVRAIEIELNPQSKTSPRPSTRNKELVMNRPIDRYPKPSNDGTWNVLLVLSRLRMELGVLAFHSLGPLWLR